MGPNFLDNYLYSGQEIADRGHVIVVSVGYRVGTLGFLSTGDASLPGRCQFIYLCLYSSNWRVMCDGHLNTVSLYATAFLSSATCCLCRGGFSFSLQLPPQNKLDNFLFPLFFTISYEYHTTKGGTKDSHSQGPFLPSDPPVDMCKR